MQESDALDLVSFKNNVVGPDRFRYSHINFKVYSFHFDMMTFKRLHFHPFVNMLRGVHAESAA